MNRGREGTKEYMNFDLYVHPREFIQKNDTDTVNRVVSTSKAIISLRDLHDIARSQKTSLDVVPLPFDELFHILRGAKDNRDKPVYANATFSVEDVNVHEVFGVQSYINMKNVHSMQDLNKFLNQLGVEHDGPAVVSSSGDEKYVSIYIPPILLYYMADGFTTPFKNAEGIIKNGSTIKINSFGSEKELDLSGLLEKAKRFVSDHGNAVPVIKDGTHRAFTKYLANVPQKTIVIRDSEELAIGVPFAFEDMVPTSEKPSDPQIRYPGLVDVRVLLTNLGIDP